VQIGFIYAYYPSLGAKRNLFRSLDNGKPLIFAVLSFLSAAPNSAALFLVISVALCDEILGLRPEAALGLPSFSPRGPDFT
jgi:hypothetical protein